MAGVAAAALEEQVRVFFAGVAGSNCKHMPWQMLCSPVATYVCVCNWLLACCAAKCYYTCFFQPTIVMHGAVCVLCGVLHMIDMLHCVCALQVNAPRGRRMAACPGIAEDAMV
jgi:hypothetical protein